MSFNEAIRTGFRKYVDFTGRARRSEFWYWVLFTVLVGIAAGILDSALGLESPIDPNNPNLDTSGPIASLTSLALLLPNLTMAVRRLHDRDRSGWWILLNLIPVIGTLVLIFGFYIKDSEPGANRFGPNPKGVDGGPGTYDPQAAYGQPAQQYPYDPQDPYDPQNPYGQSPQDPYDPQNPSGQQPSAPRPPQQ